MTETTLTCFRAKLDDLDPESRRLVEDEHREANWKRWGPYLSERQWATVREDYSANGDSWRYFPHDHARSRAYRWGEDGLLGFCDRQCRMAFALALWNERDLILKERLFGLTGPEGNHGEDVKELYYYLDSTPTHSYAKALYKYPHEGFPYEELVRENARRGLHDREFELLDTEAFRENAYWDVSAEYAKQTPDHLLIRLTVANRGPRRRRMHLLPTLWHRNTWTWGCEQEGCWPKGLLWQDGPGLIVSDHPSLGRFFFQVEPLPGESEPPLLFTENETNNERLFGVPNATPYVKDAFHRYVIRKEQEAVHPEQRGAKAAAHYVLELDPGESRSVRCRLFAADQRPGEAEIGTEFDEVFAQRIKEADAFYERRISPAANEQERAAARQAYAGLLWTKQFYHYAVDAWLEGDPETPPPPPERREGRNADWHNLYNYDVLSMPDKWEYPWFAAWDTAFHMIPFAQIDPDFAKEQLLLFLREWYMHPNGQIPAYEFNFSDVNPPVHAWACWRVYKMTGPRGGRDREFLARAFQKLVLNFTWWVNRKDIEGNNLFGGGFLGLDNIGVFDRSHALPGGAQLEQADGTAWMAFYCGTMLNMALELAAESPEYEDMASKFFEHFVAIVDAMNDLGGTGLWDEDDGFYYDKMHLGSRTLPLKVRSLVGLLPLIAAEILEQDVIDHLPGFSKRMDWFLINRPDLGRHVACMTRNCEPGIPHAKRLLAIPSRERLERVLRYLFDENEFLSPFGIRSLSKVHAERPFELQVDGEVHRVEYWPGESHSGMFGGNSNWRGPIWLPVNYLLLEALERYHKFYGDSFQVEYPTGSGHRLTLEQAAHDIAARLARLFLPDADGRRPLHGGQPRYQDDPHWRDLILFYEYFNAETGEGLGASHQTGWTALIARILDHSTG